MQHKYSNNYFMTYHIVLSLTKVTQVLRPSIISLDQMWWRKHVSRLLKICTSHAEHDHELSTLLCLVVTCCDCTLCSEKNTHSRFLLYLCGKCLDLHEIYREYSGGNKKMLNIFLATSDVMLTSYFRVCKLWVLPLKTDIWQKSLRVGKGYEAASLCKMFLENGQTNEY